MFGVRGSTKEEEKGIIPRTVRIELQVRRNKTVVWQVEAVVDFANKTEAAYKIAPMEISISSVEIICSYFQIYNEKALYDTYETCEIKPLNLRLSIDVTVSMNDFPCP